MNGIKARGGKELKKYLSGGKLTPKQMILATCYECTGGYADGKADCELKICPLYPLMPYRERPQTTPSLLLEHGESGVCEKKDNEG